MLPKNTGAPWACPFDTPAGHLGDDDLVSEQLAGPGAGGDAGEDSDVTTDLPARIQRAPSLPSLSLLEPSPAGRVVRQRKPNPYLQENYVSDSEQRVPKKPRAAAEGANPGRRLVGEPRKWLEKRFGGLTMPLDVDEAGRKVVAERRKLVAELTRVKNSEPTSSELLKNYKYGDPAEKIAEEMREALEEEYPEQADLYTAASVVTFAKALLKDKGISLKEAPRRVAGAAAGADGAAPSGGAKGGGRAGARQWAEATPGKKQQAAAMLLVKQKEEKKRENDIKATYDEVKEKWTDTLQAEYVGIFGLDPRNGFARCAADAGSTFKILRQLNEKASKYASKTGLPEQKLLLEMSQEITTAVEAVVQVRAGHDFVKEYLGAKDAEAARKQAEAAAAAGQRGKKRKAALFPAQGGGDPSDSSSGADDGDNSSDEVTDRAMMRRRLRAEAILKKKFRKVVRCDQSLARMASTQQPAFGALVLGRGTKEEGTVTLLAGDFAEAIRGPKAVRGRAGDALKGGILLLPALEAKLAEECAAVAGRRRRQQQLQPQGNTGGDGAAAAGGEQEGAGAVQTVVTPIQQDEGEQRLVGSGERMEQSTAAGADAGSDPSLTAAQQQSRGPRDGMLPTGSAGYSAFLPSANESTRAAMEVLRAQNSSLKAELKEKDDHIAKLNTQLNAAMAGAAALAGAAA